VKKPTVQEDDITKKLSQLPIDSDRTNAAGAGNINNSERTTGWEDSMIVGKWGGKGNERGVAVCSLGRRLKILNIAMSKTGKTSAHTNPSPSRRVEFSTFAIS